MTGFPFLRVLVLALLFAAATWPLLRLTSGHQRVDEVPSGVVAGEAPAIRIPAVLRVRCTHRPEHLTVRQGGVTWLEIRNPDLFSMEVPVEIPDDPAGLEVQISAGWPPGLAETAIGLELEPDGYETQRQSLWTSTPDLEEIVSFRWK